MSMDAMSWAIEQKTPSCPAKFILIMMGDSASEGGIYEVCPKYLSRTTNLTEEQVLLHVRELEKLGLIRRAPKWEMLSDGLFAVELMVPGRKEVFA